MPVLVEPENVEPPALHEMWQQEVLRTLQAILASQTVLIAEQRALTAAIVRLVAERPELPVGQEPAAASMEPPGSNEPLGTWILEDARVAAIEEAIVQEQRVRGQAYGG